MRRLAILCLLLTACCAPQRREGVWSAEALPSECAGHVVSLAQEGDGLTLAVGPRGGRVMVADWRRGVLDGESALITGGAPTLDACGEGAYCAGGAAESPSACVVALWRLRWRFDVR